MIRKKPFSSLGFIEVDLILPGKKTTKFLIKVDSIHGFGSLCENSQDCVILYSGGQPVVAHSCATVKNKIRRALAMAGTSDEES